MRIFFIIFILALLGCERHTQETTVTGKKKAKVVNLTVIETISSAIVQNDIALIEETLAGGEFEINVPNKDGELILNKAVVSNRLVIGNILIESGADPNIEDEKGMTANNLIKGNDLEIDWVAIFDRTKIRKETSVSKVFEALVGARADTEDKFLPLIRGLFQLGAPIDGRNAGEFTYLMEASSRGLPDIVSFLCTIDGIDPNVQVVRGRGRRAKTFTALILAKNQAIKDVLYACGAVDI
ncbi:MAG: hypothetical protein NXH75_11680 [Halobacteriovoraceae bacterium]|nr:hypothetical protein [Halobacteriovoraceae bacterium]